MSKVKTVLVSVFMLISLLSINISSTTRIVLVMDFQFSPASMNNVTVGDTIKWQWVNGDHTTTSISVPAGASSWNAQITSTSQTFIYVVAVAGNYAYVCTPHSKIMQASFVASPIGIVPIGGSVPSSFSLGQNFPNPFNPVTNIKIDVPSSSFVRLTVYDLIGNQVEVLVNQNLNSGSYSVDWSASNYPSGIYFYTMKSGSFTDTKRMVLVK